MIVSVRSRVYNQIVYLLQHTISTSKGLIVINEDGKDTDYNKVFDEALKIAVNPQSYVSASAVSTNNASNSNSGNNVSGDTVTGVDNNKGNVIKDDNNKDNKTYDSYKVIEKLSDMDVIDISGINSLPYVNIIYDYIGNDAYAAQKAVNTSEAVVVALRRSLEELYPNRKIFFLTGVLSDKDYPSMLGELLPLSKQFVTITPDSDRALSAGELAQYLRRAGAEAQPCGSVSEGIQTVLDLAQPNDVVCVCGSLYMIGEARHALGLC